MPGHRGSEVRTVSCGIFHGGPQKPAKSGARHHFSVRLTQSPGVTSGHDALGLCARLFENLLARAEERQSEGPVTRKERARPLITKRRGGGRALDTKPGWVLSNRNLENPSERRRAYLTLRLHLRPCSLPGQACETFSAICSRIKCLVLSMNASLSARQHSRSTPTPGCPSASAAAIRDMYPATCK